MKPRYDHTIRWLQYTSNCNFPLWKLKELRVKVVSILGEGGEGALSSERWGDPAILARVCQLRAAPWCATISWPACLLATHTRSSCTFSLTLSVKSSQVNWRQALRENYCACSWSLSSKNDKKMISCARVYWICHLDSWIFHPGLCFISFQKKFNYPVPSHFQFSGRDGSGTWKKVRDGSGTGIPSDPDPVMGQLRRNFSRYPQGCLRSFFSQDFWSTELVCFHPRPGKLFQPVLSSSTTLLISLCD